ncbi:MAG: hypothetical protein EYC70_13355 [Planctomycetota bacterium]|nr:MAG: hypothetical protein EYC70_13355 [Planctomycetota bacterium]
MQENYGYPVDTVLISPDLKVLGHLNVEEPAAMDPHGYLRFLRKGLAEARGEEIETPAEEEVAPVEGMAALVLRPDAASGSVLDVIQRRGFGEPSMVFYPIDASAFAAGGTLEIVVRMGASRPAGRFELCAPVGDQPGYLGPVETLESVGQRQTATMVYEFPPGAFLGLAAMPAAGSAEGDSNAFLATITVRAR